MTHSQVVVAAAECPVGVLVPVIAVIRQAHPDVIISVRCVATRQIPAAISAGTIDFGLVRCPPHDARLAVVHIANDRCIALLAPAHPLATRTHITFEGLQRAVVISLESQEADGSIDWQRPELHGVA